MNTASRRTCKLWGPRAIRGRSTASSPKLRVFGDTIPRSGHRFSVASIHHAVANEAFFKHFPSAFHRTDLAAPLESLAVDTLVITGLTTSRCDVDVRRDHRARSSDPFASHCESEPLPAPISDHGAAHGKLMSDRRLARPAVTLQGIATKRSDSSSWLPPLSLLVAQAPVVATGRRENGSSVTPRIPGSNENGLRNRKPLMCLVAGACNRTRLRVG